MPEAHLICGATGAGKTTYAMRLAEREGALRLSIDDWMTALYWMDSPQPISYAWAKERADRSLALMLAVTEQALAVGTDVVLDVGFFFREQRRQVVQAIRDAGGEPRLHYLAPPPEERWRRVERRNAERGTTFAMTVTREMFDFCEDLFEPPGEDELAGALVLPEPSE